MESVNFGAIIAAGLGVFAMAGTGCAGSNGGGSAATTSSAGSNRADAAVNRPVLEVGAPAVSADVLRGAVEAHVGIGDLGPARVERVWRWRPVAGEELIVWATCRGRMDTRACTIAVGRIEANQQVRLFLNEPSGWSIPLVGETSDHQELIATGDDGRGTWRQLLRFEPASGGSVQVNRRMYGDGMW